MKLIFNKSLFVDNLLGPVSKLADNLMMDFQQDELDKQWYAKTLVTSSDNSVILIGKVQCKVQDSFKCIVPDCKTFLRLFSGIDNETINLDVDSNAIKFDNNSFSFKYHLLDESYLVNKKSFSEERLNALTFDTTFNITKQKLSEIIKFNSIVPDAEKLYFFSKNLGIFAKISDEQKVNTNEIITEVATAFNGQLLTEGFPLNIQSILLFSFCSDEIKVSVNHQLKIFKFETPYLSYIVSGLVR